MTTHTAPEPSSDDAAILGLVPGDEITVDRLCGEWWISQLRRGHRFSTDDMLIAYVASGLRPETMLQLDLGAALKQGGVGDLPVFIGLQRAGQGDRVGHELRDLISYILRLVKCD